MPREVSTAANALRILDAATIFMALVILPMFLMARMRNFTAQWKCRGQLESYVLAYDLLDRLKAAHVVSCLVSNVLIQPTSLVGGLSSGLCIQKPVL